MGDLIIFLIWIYIIPCFICITGLIYYSLDDEDNDDINKDFAPYYKITDTICPIKNFVLCIWLIVLMFVCVIDYVKKYIFRSKH